MHLISSPGLNRMISSCSSLVELTLIPFISNITSNASMPAISAALLSNTFEINTLSSPFSFKSFATAY